MCLHICLFCFLFWDSVRHFLVVVRGQHHVYLGMCSHSYMCLCVYVYVYVHICRDQRSTLHVGIWKLSTLFFQSLSLAEACRGSYAAWSVSQGYLLASALVSPITSWTPSQHRFCRLNLGPHVGLILTCYLIGIWLVINSMFKSTWQALHSLNHLSHTERLLIQRYYVFWS